MSGQDRNGRHVFVFDTNNNEDFSDEDVIYPEHFGKVFRLLSDVLPWKFPYGHRATATVEFDYLDGKSAETRRVDVEVHRYTQYMKQKDPAVPKFRGRVDEYRRGRVIIDGQLYELAVYNKGRFATYSSGLFNRILWDLNQDGKFGNERESAEYYDIVKPFNIGDTTFEVQRVSASGDEIVLRKSHVPVPRKIEIKRGSAAPDFTVRDLNGRQLRLSDFRGKYVLLDFWATWCGPCIKDTPDLKALSARFDRDTLEIIGISADTRRADVRNYMKASNIKWTQILDTVDNNSEVAKLYNIGGLPNYVLIDRKGNVLITNRWVRVLLTLISPVL